MQAAVATEIQRVTLEETQRITSGSTFFHSILVSNDTGTNYEVIFTDNDGVEILSIAVLANATKRYKVSFFADNGMIITGLNDSGVSVTLAFTDDTVPVAPQPYIDGKALSFDGSEWTKNKAAGDLLSIANAWSIQCIHNNDFSTLNSFLVSIQTPSGALNQITFEADGISSPETVHSQIRDNAGSIIKFYDWDIDVAVGTSVDYILTWDGTDLLFYADGVDQIANVTKTTDDTGVMADSLREIAFADLGSDFASLRADMHSVAMWDVALTPAEILSVHNGENPQGLDLRYPTGDYDKEDNLMHYWRLGLDKSDLGRDWGNASILVNIDEDSNDITDADIVEYLPGATDLKALDFITDETLFKSSDVAIGIANEWSIQINNEPGDDAISMGVIHIRSISDATSEISINLRGNIANDPIKVVIGRDDGVGLKEYRWNNAFVSGVKVSHIVSWDGTDLKFYLDGVDQGDADALVVDNSGSMSAIDRRVSIGSSLTAVPYTGTIHSTSIWNVVLTQAEITALQNSGSPEDFDNRFNFGDYASSDSLQHYWRHGFDDTDIGKDYGNAATLIDVGDDAENITAADIVDY